MVQKARRFLQASHDPCNDWKRLIVVGLTAVNIYLSQSNSEKLSDVGQVVASTQAKVEVPCIQSTPPLVRPEKKGGE